MLDMSPDVNKSDGKVIAKKEYPGGLIGEMEVTLPAVLGIQASEQPPRYVAVSKVRQAMKTATIEEQDAAELGSKRRTGCQPHVPARNC